MKKFLKSKDTGVDLTQEHAPSVMNAKIHEIIIPVIILTVLSMHLPRLNALTIFEWKF